MYGILSVEINYACGRLGVTAEYPATSIIFFFLTMMIWIASAIRLFRHEVLAYNLYKLETTHRHFGLTLSRCFMLEVEGLFVKVRFFLSRFPQLRNLTSSDSFQYT